MLYRMSEPAYRPDPRLEHALDVLLILHADHEQDCSTAAVRGVGSSQVDPYSAVAAGIAALYGPLHGGANEAVLRMLGRIQRRENVSAFIQAVKRGSERLIGFGQVPIKTTTLARKSSGRWHTRCSRSRAATRCLRSRLSLRGSPARTTTSSRAACIPTSTFTLRRSTG